MKRKQISGQNILLIKPYWGEELIPQTTLIMHQLLIENTPFRLQKYFKARGVSKKVMKNFEELYHFKTKYTIGYGLLSVASVLEQAGYKAAYLPLEYYKEHYGQKKGWVDAILRKKLKNITIVGLTATTPEFSQVVGLCKLIKSINKNIITVVGGPHVSFLPEQSLREAPFIDFIIRGEGERAMVELVRSIDLNLSYDNVPNISYRKKDTLLNNTIASPLDGNELPLPAFHLLPKNIVSLFNFYVVASRGCPFSCAFCSESKMFSHCARRKKPSRLVEEIETIYRLGCKQKILHIADSEFENSTYITAFLDELDRCHVNIKFSINVRPDFYKRVSIVLLRRMIKKGFFEFFVGIESGSDTILNNIHKQAHFDDVIKTLLLLKKARAPIVRSYWIVGLPGETLDTAMETAKKYDALLSERLILDGITRIFVPTPGSDIFHHPKKYQITIDTQDWSKYSRFSFPPPFVSSTLSKLEYLSIQYLMNSILLRNFGINQKEFSVLSEKAEKNYIKTKFP